MSRPSDSFSTPRVAAGALFFDSGGRVLLVHPTYKDTWDVPGGYVEHGESPAAACQRELLEELGINRAPCHLLSIDWAPSANDGDKLLFLFDCGEIGIDEPRIQLDESELDEWKWVPLEELEDYAIARIAARIHSTVESPGGYLEYGQLAAGSPLGDHQAKNVGNLHRQDRLAQRSE